MVSTLSLWNFRADMALSQEFFAFRRDVDQPVSWLTVKGLVANNVPNSERNDQVLSFFAISRLLASCPLTYMPNSHNFNQLFSTGMVLVEE